MHTNELNRRSFLEKSLLATAGAGAVLATSQCKKMPRETIVLDSQPEPIIPVKLGTNEKLKVGVLGCGNRSKGHISAMNVHDRIEIAALCDILPEMLEEKKKLVKNGTPRLYTDYQEMSIY